MPKLIDIFWIFLKLGCTSFGGPAAHLIFFKQLFVEKKHWLNEQQYAQLLALTQLLPGPSSSQMGMAIGYLHQRHLGAIVAWLGFTLPSTLLMFFLAYFIQQHYKISAALFSAIQSIILAIIIFAFWQMFKSYCRTKLQFLLMSLSAILLLIFSNAWIQFAIIFISAVLGIFIHKVISIQPSKSVVEHETEHIFFRSVFALHHHSISWLVIFILIFFGLWLGTLFFTSTGAMTAFNLYKTGALVFGGGHVVLPMLYQDFVHTGMISQQNFEFGYTLAQFMPGPLFTFASYMGSFLPLSPFPLFNALIATLSIFLPSFFFIFTALPYWSKLISNVHIQNSVTLINAAVVGFLLSIIVPMAEKNLNHLQDIFSTVLMLCSLKLNISIFISVPIILLLRYMWNTMA
ncbi:chromate efflux transporter [Acinetobacter bereziniae]|uniref:Chromate efflux transporter n=1 Tax=Acinetobacter bereziniae TaxID=106648 RepID=A0A8I1A8U1_ACIBZ|nr:chromate efflux transporter [Acinetobacter bereziniae]QQC83784.1 chromate efflux transporter [Acinetobacter bereziniae]UUN96956.1 chromate efflux transporter [Acinetobacter bereziniae]